MMNNSFKHSTTAVLKCLLIVAVFVFLPLSQTAADSLKKIGQPCDSNGQCLSDDCEESNVRDEHGNFKWFCDCNNDDDCKEYGETPNDGGEWDCIDQRDAPYDLDFCASTKGMDKRIPDITGKAGAGGAEDKNIAAKIAVSKLTDDITDRMAIKIPGLDFSKLSGTVDEQGYLHIPWIGEYIAAIYKFAMVAASILAVVIIIMQGARVVISGGGEQKTAAYKRIGQAVVGLVILWGSYALLYNINPDLVTFKALKVKFIEPVPMVDDPDIKRDVAEAPPCAGPNNPSQSSGIGDKKYLGQLDNLACGTRKLQDIKFIVLHEGAKTTEITVNVFKQNHVSSHYSIDRDGAIYQLVGEERRAWHAGQINAYAIGIDLSKAKDCPTNGKSDKCTYTNKQLQALKTLIDNIFTRIGTTKTDTHVIGHCQVAGTTHIDPRNFDWSKIDLNNAAHYKNAGDITSPCKIIFELKTLKELQKRRGAEPAAFCMIDDQPALEHNTQAECEEESGIWVSA